MSNIDKRALRAAAEKAKDNFMPNFMVPTRDVLALLDELEAKDKQIAELSQKADIYDMLRQDYVLQGSLVDFVDWQAKRIAEYQELISGLVGVSSSILREVERINKAAAAGKGAK